MKNNIESKIKELRSKLKKWNEEYYINNKPSVDDAIFDFTLNKLIQYERENPEFYDSESPTQKVGGGFSSSFEKVKHNARPMLSLKNAFNEKDLDHFDKTIKKTLNKFTYFVEPKIDGVSISITYKEGKLVRAASRGNGEYGEDVTLNIKQISNIPHTIKDKRYMHKNCRWKS